MPSRAAGLYCDDQINTLWLAIDLLPVIQHQRVDIGYRGRTATPKTTKHVKEKLSRQWKQKDIIGMYEYYLRDIFTLG